MTTIFHEELLDMKSNIRDFIDNEVEVFAIKSSEKMKFQRELLK